MATNAKNLAELLNTDSTVAVGDIADGSVTTAKIAANAVTSSKMANGSVGVNQLADDGITDAKFADTVPFGRRNALINGDFQEWQRGTSGTVNSYTCDRWYGWGNQHNLTQQQAENATHNSGRFALRVAHNDSTSSTFSSIAQTLETKDAAQFRGKKATFSIDIKKGSAFTGSLTLQIVTRTDAEGTINSGTRQVLVTSDITSSVTGSLQRFTCTTSSVCAQNIRAIGVNVNHTNTSGTDANNYFQVERAQLEIGEHATAFETQSAADNLMACRRYYQINYTSWYGVAAAAGYFVSDSIFYVPPMRANPAVAQTSFTSGSGGRFTVTGATSSTLQGTSIYSSPTSAGGNSGYNATWSADAEI